MALETGITPIGPRIVVQLQDVNMTQTAAGVFLPQTHDVKSHKADVVAIGDKIEKCKVGDLVLISIGAGDKAEYRQEEYTILWEMDVLAILERD